MAASVYDEMTGTPSNKNAKTSGLGIANAAWRPVPAWASAAVR